MLTAVTNALFRPHGALLLLVAVCTAQSLMKALSAPHSFWQRSHQRRPASAHGGLYSAAAHSAVGAVQLPLAPMWILGALLVQRRSKQAQHKQDVFFH